MKQFYLLMLFPLSAIAKTAPPSMSGMWWELGFLIIVMISLKIASFSMKHKAIIFVAYILAGIITKTLWFPVLLWAIMYYIFRTQSDNDSTF